MFKESFQFLQKIPQLEAVLAKEITTQQVLKQADSEIFLQHQITFKSSRISLRFPSRLNHCEDAPVILFKKEEALITADIANSYRCFCNSSFKMLFLARMGNYICCDKKVLRAT